MNNCFLVNDNVPVFPPYQEITINEDLEVGSVISTLTANDVDTYPMLTYYKQRASKFRDDPFDIDLYTGKIVLKSPLNIHDTDKDQLNPQLNSQQQQYHLNILASDSKHTVETQVLIKINRNEINEVPVFVNQGNLFVEIDGEKNNCPLHSVNCEIAKVQVVENENNQLKNHKIIFSLGNNSDGFYIDQFKGIIYNNKTLRSTTSKVNNLIVYAKYKGRNGQSQAGVVIKVPKYENTIFKKNKIIDIEIDGDEENIGKTIFKLPKTDSGYNFNDHEAKKYFQFMLGNELVLIDKPLKSQFSFNILSNSTLTSLYLVNIKIKGNQQVNKSFKTLSIDVSLSENVPIGREVYSLKQSNEEFFKYNIISGNELNHFRIDEATGTIFVNANLDYEHIHHYQLGISLEDQLNHLAKSFAIVNVNLINVNNQCPKFSMLHYKTIVDENVPIASRIIKITTLETYNISLNYTLIKPKTLNAPFEFDQKNGYLITTGIIDYESIDFSPPSYKLTLRASDNGKERLCNSIETLIEIQIGSIDEYPPRFTSNSYKFKVTAKSGMSSVKVGQVLASDADSGPDGQVVYSLRSSSPTNTIELFKINAKTGEITINTNGLESQHHFSLIVSASSGRPNSMSVLTVVEVNLIIIGYASDGEAVVKTEDITSVASTSSTSNPTLLPGWILFLIVLLMIVTVVLLVSVVVMRMQHQQQLMVGHNRHLTSHNNIRSFLRKIGPMGATANISSYGGSAFVVPGTAPPPCYNDVTLSSTVGNAEGHSASSGRGSAEDEDEVHGDIDDVDEEIRMINEGSDYFGNSNENTPENDITSTTEYLARLGVVNHNEESIMHNEEEEDEDMFDELGNINSTKATNLLNSMKNNGASIRRCINVQNQIHESPSLCGSLSSIVHSQEELSGSYNWDYLQHWEPKYQPLAQIFAEIARLKRVNGECDNEELAAMRAQIAIETGSIRSSSTESSHHHGINRFGTMSTSSPSTLPNSNACYQTISQFSQLKSTSTSSIPSDNNSITTVRADDELRI